jgi:hypothetical protein
MLLLLLLFHSNVIYVYFYSDMSMYEWLLVYYVAFEYE